MSLVNKTLSSLTGGISQQVANLRLSNQCEEQVNYKSSLVNGLQSRPPLKLITSTGTLKTNVAFYPIDRDRDNKYNLFISPAGLTVIDEAGTEQNVTQSSANLAYLSLASAISPYKAYKILTLADHTYILNTTKIARLLSDTYSPWKNQALVFIKQVSASTTWTLNINGTSISVGYGGANNDTGLPDLYVNGVKHRDDVSMSTIEIAKLLQGTTASSGYVKTTDTTYDSSKTYYWYYEAGDVYNPITATTNTSDGETVETSSIQNNWTTRKRQDNCYEYITAAPNCFSDFTITQAASTLLIRKNDGGSFTIGLTDTRSDSYSHLITSKVQQFADLPTVAPDGYIAKVIGAVSSNADDYYVMFNAGTAGDFGKGTWQECAEPSSQFALDPTTMPYELVHISGTNWVFQPVTWKEKETGDLDSSPNPSFVNKKLSNIFLFMNRLCFLADDILCMSAAADHTNWWNETATTQTDSDPIFLAASTDKLVTLYDFGVLDDDLILFSRHDQFRLSYGDVLSPKTAAIKAVANTAFAEGSGIVTAGTRLYFGCHSGAYFTVNEFGTSATTGQKEAAEITSHVPNLMQYADDLRLCGSENVKTLCVYSSADVSKLFIYNYFISGGQKLQSSWSAYTFAGATLKGAFFRDNVLWLYMTKNSLDIVATMDMSEKTQSESAVDPVLDFLTTLTSEQETYQITIPSYITPANAVVLMPVNATTNNKNTVVSIDGQTLTLKKPVTTCYVGELYKRTYVFSTQYPTQKKSNGSEVAITFGRWQLQTLKLNYGISGPFTVRVKPLYDKEAEGYKYIFSGKRAGQESAMLNRLYLDEGTFELPLRGRNTDLQISIEADSWLPESFISAEWQGLYVTKVKQL